MTGDFRCANPPVRQIGDYRILREIGRGGMGVVYEAEQVSLGRRVALKVLPGQVSSDRLVQERFRREARAAARLHHTNIVPVYDVGQDGDVCFYAMQFIQGLGLEAVIAELRQLLDRARSQSKIKTASDRRSHQPRGEHSGQGIENPAVGAGVEVSAVMRSILTGRFDPSGTSPEQVGATRPLPARTLATPAGIGIEVSTRRTRLRIGADRDRERDRGRRNRSATNASSRTSLVSIRLARLQARRSCPAVPSSRRSSRAGAGSSAAWRRSAGRSPGAWPMPMRGARAPGHQAVELAAGHRGVVWIADFGLAKGEDEGLTQSGDILGTLRYMAPERFRGEGDARADVYALGLTLYELLTLRPGFDSPDRLKLIEQIKTEEPPKPRAVDARIPRDLETIVLKAIEKDPKARYQTAEAMGEDLGRFLADEPIRARQVSSAERYWRWARRNPVIAVMGGVLTAVLIATTLGSLLAATYFRSLAGSESCAKQQSQEAQDMAVKARKLAVEAEHQALVERDNSRGLSSGLASKRESPWPRRGRPPWDCTGCSKASRAPPAESAAIQRVIRINLSAWSEQVHGLRHIIRVPILAESPAYRCVSCAFSPDGHVLAVASATDSSTGMREAFNRRASPSFSKACSWRSPSARTERP